MYVFIPPNLGELSTILEFGQLRRFFTIELNAWYAVMNLNIPLGEGVSKL